MSWIWQAVSNGETVFHGPNVGCFRLLFGLSLLIKCGVEWRRGHHRFFDPENYIGLLYATRRSHGKWLNHYVWRSAFFIRFLSSFSIFLGWSVTVAAGMLSVALIVECIGFSKYHAQFMLLCSVSLIFSESASRAFSIGTFYRSQGWTDFLAQSAGARERVIVPLLACLPLMAMYLFSGLHKCRRPFLSGQIAALALTISEREAANRKGIDSTLPPRLRGALITDGGVPRVALQMMMHCVVAVELLLPVGFLFELSLIPAVVAGFALHCAFTAFLPTTLLHFSLACISTYVLFFNPLVVAGVFQ